MHVVIHAPTVAAKTKLLDDLNTIENAYEVVETADNTVKIKLDHNRMPHLSYCPLLSLRSPSMWVWYSTTRWPLHLSEPQKYLRTVQIRLMLR